MKELSPHLSSGGCERFPFKGSSYVAFSFMFFVGFYDLVLCIYSTLAIMSLRQRVLNALHIMYLVVCMLC